MQSKATTVEKYLAELPVDRREAIAVVRDTIQKNLDPKFEEGMQYGAIGYYVPHSVYPPGYHCDPTQPLPFAGLASQKNHMAIYLMSIYGDPEAARWFQEAWAKTGKKLDMGKSCIRFKRLEDVALDVIGAAIKRVTVDKYIRQYEANLGESRRPSSATKPAGRKKAAATRTAGAKSAKKKQGVPKAQTKAKAAKTTKTARKGTGRSRS